MSTRRIVDIMIAALGLVILSPLLVLISLVVWVGMGNPVLFRQERTGLGGRSFAIYKIRTMREPLTDDGGTISDDDRITSIGSFLRATSLDELPELWNVIKGEMSLIGPRPLLPEYLPLYTAHQGRRHEVRPGITGWAQVHGRNATTWENRLELDIWYIDNRSFFLDMRILLLTVKAVLLRKGINPKDKRIMDRFHGTTA